MAENYVLTGTAVMGELSTGKIINLLTLYQLVHAGFTKALKQISIVCLLKNLPVLQWPESHNLLAFRHICNYGM